MSTAPFKLYFKKPMYAKIFPSFCSESHSFFDFRAGCDLCCDGNAMCFETNILDLIKQNENGIILLNDLDVTIEEECHVKTLYRTTDKKTINSLYRIKKKMFLPDFSLEHECSVVKKSEDSRTGYGGEKITSSFVDYDKNELISEQKCAEKKSAKLCSRCVIWYVVASNPYSEEIEIDIQNKFKIIDGMQIFWENFLKFELPNIGCLL